MTSESTPQRLDRTLFCYRIGDPDGRFPIYDPQGSARYPGRWNDFESPVIYSSEHYSTAMLEVLANGRGQSPPNQHYIVIIVPRGTSYEIVTKDHLAGWDSLDPLASRDYGTRWFRQARSAILLVPSYVARIERNIVINPAHPEAGAVETTLPEPVWWDARLFE